MLAPWSDRPDAGTTSPIDTPPAPPNRPEAPVADEQQLTLGELGRRLDAGLADIKEDIRALAARVDDKVDAQVLALQQEVQDERHRLLADQVGALQKSREEDARRLQETRRWLLGVVVIPLLAVLLPLLLTHGSL